MAKVTTYKLVAVTVMLMYYCLFNTVFAQKNYYLVVRSIDQDSLFLARKLGLKTAFPNSQSCDNYISKLPGILQSKGFLSSSIDSVIKNEDSSIIYLFVGEQYTALNLNVREQDRQLLQQAGLQYNANKSKQLTFSDYNIIVEKLLDYFENTGYPFAKISLDSLTVHKNQIDASINITRGYPYHIDSIRVYGSAKISKNFIHRYLNIERGSIYSRSKLDRIAQRLQELPYLQQLQAWDVTMLNTGSLVNLYLQPKKSNQINVLAGFLPANQQLGGKLLLTVDANLQLQNAFGGGESLGLVWQQIQPKSPRLHLQLTQPYMLNSPFGTDFLFELYKKDSAFLNINAQLGLLYMATANRISKIVLQTQRTNVLQVDTLNIISSRRLPDIADVSSLNLGFDYNVNNTDYRFNPREGSEFFLSTFFGNKTIRKNTTITQIKEADFDYNSLYDTIKLKTYQLRLRFNAARYFKTGKQTVLKTAVNGGWYESQNYFRNELFQIGGYRLLRGFNEESIYTNRYAVGTLEYRYLVGANSNFFVFTDLGYASNPIIKQSNTYLGAGLGLSFETKGGIFNLSYAVGKRNDLNFDIKQSKIHFGYVTLF